MYSESTSGRSSRSTLMFTKRSFMTRGRLVVLERLVLHDVAPVAGGVPDREEDRLVLVPRLGERLFAPRVPVHRVVGVLQEVGTGFLGEAVHAHTLPCEAGSNRRARSRAHDERRRAGQDESAGHPDVGRVLGPESRPGRDSWSMDRPAAPRATSRRRRTVGRTGRSVGEEPPCGKLESSAAPARRGHRSGLAGPAPTARASRSVRGTGEAPGGARERARRSPSFTTPTGGLRDEQPADECRRSDEDDRRRRRPGAGSELRAEGVGAASPGRRRSPSSPPGADGSSARDSPAAAASRRPST